MSTLYITDYGITVTKIDNRIIARKRNKVIEDLPAKDIERIVIFGNAHLTIPAMKFFLEKGIDVSLLSKGGSYKGRVQPGYSKDANLRRMQYQLSFDKDFCLNVSKSIVSGKLQNMVTFLKRQRKQTIQVQRAIPSIQNSQKNLRKTMCIDSARGYEGSASAMYYKALSSLYKKEFQFKNRTHHPPLDETNILLSLGYSMLFNRLYSMVNIVGLDPYQGFYHQLDPGHAALVSDLIEEFRSIIVDSVTLFVVNTGEITLRNFFKKEGRLMLNRDGLQKFILRYECRLKTVVLHPVRKVRLSYEQCIEEQARHFVRVISGEEKMYAPFII